MANLDRASGRAFNPATEFSEFSRKEITEYTAAFRTYDVDKSGTLNIEELKRMMEKLGHPQTHTALCAMMREVDQDHDGEISQREFFSIFRRARDGSLQNCQGLQEMATSLSCIDVSEVGVGGAKSFFEAKANELKRSKEAEDEVKAEQAARKESMLAEVQRKTDFKDRLNKFNKGGA
ncbi:EF-hand domain family [Tribonema minus]|uniref:EF-hand domain family n=1 Tax=Tribonema minus TaxID=303371 RepID=A0A835YWT5_9STRA|nr:EF-hand domain family [Tribonema minus]